MHSIRLVAILTLIGLGSFPSIPRSHTVLAQDQASSWQVDCTVANTGQTWVADAIGSDVVLVTRDSYEISRVSTLDCTEVWTAVPDFEPWLIAVADDSVAAMGFPGVTSELASFDLASGDKLWSRVLPLDDAAFVFAAGPDWILSTSTQLSLPSGQTGEELWTVLMWATYPVFDREGSRIFANAARTTTRNAYPGHFLVSLDAGSGALNWSLVPDSERQLIFPALIGDALVITTATNAGPTGPLTRIDPSNGEVLWTYEPTAGVANVLPIDSDVIAWDTNFGGSTVARLDLRTGEAIWSFTDDLPINVLGVSDDIVLAQMYTSEPGGGVFDIVALRAVVRADGPGVGSQHGRTIRGHR